MTFTCFKIQNDLKHKHILCKNQQLQMFLLKFLFGGTLLKWIKTYINIHTYTRARTHNSLSLSLSPRGCKTSCFSSGSRFYSAVRLWHPLAQPNKIAVNSGSLKNMCKISGFFSQLRKVFYFL